MNMGYVNNQFNQLCVWPGTMMGDSTAKDFENFFAEQGFRVMFCEEVITNGSEERNEEGGRHDILFYIHDEDVLKFALLRLSMGIRWWEDVVSYNDEAYMYPEEILKKYSVNW